MFGKTFGEYIHFERWILVLIALVFAFRLGSSLAGVPNVEVRWISINLVVFLATVYCAVAVHTKGFGAYKQLFGLLLVQNVLAHVLIALAIVLAIVTGVDNIFTAPEYAGGADGKTWVHVIAHLFVAWALVALIGWGIGSLILLLTRKLKPQPIRA